MKRVLIIGGAPGGITLALEQASAGNKVYLVESQPGIDIDQILINAENKGNRPA